ncbi:MAG: HD domain-containing protein [Gammaproteobacteria bacterium]|nr:HD domain-containing protein [Gammaproteobacteria bacterium]MBU1979818.1 HD domain-containing protein [Gammaproteobacteria bacterium]
MIIKPSIKTITVKSLVNVLSILALVLLLITGLNFRSLSTQAIENQALAHAELVKAGLTSHMKARIMDRRDYYLDEIRELHHVNALNIIRGDVVTKQFGPGKASERIADPIANQAFDTKKPVFILNEFSLQPTVRVIIPYIASQQGGLNCLSCHKVTEGTVLGAVDIELDVKEYRNHALWIMASLLALSIVAFALILVNTARTIKNHVQQPLETLIDHAMTAYKQHLPVSSDQFYSREFSNVADEINLFNTEIIAHQEILQKKNEELLALNDEIESTLRETIYTMGVIEERRSQETANHTRRVSLYSQLLAQKAELTPREVELITAASPLHDIGKLGIPDEVLLKPGHFTDEERHIMMNHPAIGYAMLRHSQRDTLVAAGIIAYQHQEKWDGSGYPQGLAGENIHIFGRIVALADVFDALYSSRIYKEAWSLEKVVEWFGEQRGIHFDPQLVDIFLADIDEFVAIYNQHPADKETEV